MKVDIVNFFIEEKFWNLEPDTVKQIQLVQNG